MTDQDKSEPSSEQEEPFLLTVLPFAGLGLLLILAVVWRLVPTTASEPGPETASPQQLAASVIERWEKAKERDIPIDPGRDYVIGNENARVTLVEFSDFECPYCRNAANGAHDVLEKYGDDVRLVFKNFPLDRACNQGMDQPMHHLACQAAVLARCAGEQDPQLFWNTHDALFREPQLTPEALNRIPVDIGLDLPTLTACMEAPASLEPVVEDIAVGRSVGVGGTPVFFANGRKLSDYRPAALEAVVGHILSGD